MINEKQIKVKARESRKFNSLELPQFRQDFPELHAANLEDVSFTDSERQKLWNLLDEENKAEEEGKRGNSGNNQPATMTFDEHVNEDWDKYGSMEDDFGYDEDDFENDEDEEMEDVDEEYESEDTERESDLEK